MISLVTVADSPDYLQFLPRWWGAVTRMDPQPDEVIIVTGRDHLATIATHSHDATIIPMDEPFSARHFQRGYETATSEWVGYCGIDDLMFPNAYKDLPDTDIIVGTIVLSNGGLWEGQWNPARLQHQNTLPAHSPVRKSLWQEAGGFPNIRWSDWGMWISCSRLNPTAAQAPNPLAVFDIGTDRQTMSGVSLPEETRQTADRELFTWAHG